MPRAASAPRLRRVLAAAALAVAAAACTAHHAGAPPATRRAAGTAAAGAAAPAPTAGPLPALATERGDLPGIEATLNRLAHSDPDTLTLSFTLSNRGRRPFTVAGQFAEPGRFRSDDYEDYDVAGVYLVDGPHRRKYLVDRDAAGHCLCSNRLFYLPQLAPGQQATFFAELPSPPPSVTTVTVVVPHFPPFERVAVGP